MTLPHAAGSREFRLVAEGQNTGLADLNKLIETSKLIPIGDMPAAKNEALMRNQAIAHMINPAMTAVLGPGSKRGLMAA